MCELASFVVTKDNIFFSKTSNSHTDIIEDNNLYVDGACGANAVSVELSPPDEDFNLPYSQWILKTDQTDVPDWYNEKDAKTRILTVIDEWRKYHACSQGNEEEVNILIGGDQVTQLSGNGSIQKGAFHVTQKAKRGAVQVVEEISEQIALDNVVQVGGFQTTQTASYEARQFAASHARQHAEYCAVQIATDFAVQVSEDCSKQMSGDYSKQTAGDYSMQITGDHSTQTAGVGTIQITKWLSLCGWQVATRVVGEKEANTPYRVDAGVWTPLNEKADQQTLKPLDITY